MLNARTLAITGVAAILAAVLVWKWVAGWGYVTLDVRNAPLAKVIKSIERQGGVKISTNADPALPVTMLVDRVTAYEAVDTLATFIDADARLAYVAAKDSRQIKNVLAAFSGGNNPGGWVVLSGFGGRGGGGQREGDGQNGQPRDQSRPQNQTAQNQLTQPPTAQGGDRQRNGGERRGGDQGGGGFGGGNFGSMMGDGTTDPRTIVWKPSDMPEKTLQAYFDQGAQKTGAIFALPEGWSPSVSKLPKEGPIGEVAVRLVKSAKGAVQEVFLLTVQPPRPQQTAGAEDNSGRWEFTRTVFTPQRGGQRNPEWQAERIQAQIAALPAPQQAEAKEQIAFWQSLRSLPEEERRAKIEEMMNNPQVQERMEERMSLRDSKTAPKKREERMRNYIERKQQMKGPSQKS